MVDELKEQLGGVTPDAIICSVGGGGLMNGIILGCQRAGWDKGNAAKFSSVSMILGIRCV
jgi:threonine dehydratase